MRRRRLLSEMVAPAISALILAMIGTASTKAQTFTVLHGFDGGTDGGAPFAGLIHFKGQLYGTTTIGGNLDCNVGHGCGSIFSINRRDEEEVTFTFPNSSYGAYPYSGILADSSGNLYGTIWGGATSFGGTYGLGAVYEVDTAGNEAILHNFAGAPDGEYPLASLIKDSRENLYGTTSEGGTSLACADGNGCGTIFEIDGETSAETVLHSFAGAPDAALPVFGSLLLSSGNLYGTTQSGGALNQGTVFKFNLKTGKESILHSFSGFPTDGAAPQGGLVRDDVGNIYGTTLGGGTLGLGAVFEINTRTGAEILLYSFAGGVSDGSHPYSTLDIDRGGNLYGTTFDGGANGSGTIFEISSGGTETVLHSFSYPTDGGNPYAGLYRDSKGNLYGTTVTGGPGGLGTAFELEP